ncbi:hypothetical protein ACHAPV_006004 [Trichoderma viride]
MASMPYKDITSSPPFTFIVGPNKKEHTIHSALVARQSPALDALINGGMKESIERRVIWKDVDEEDFIRFSQYVYTGDYDAAKPSKREAEGIDPSQVTLSKNTHPSAFGSTNTHPSAFGSTNTHPSAFGSINGGGLSGSVAVPEEKPLWERFEALHPLPPPAPIPNLGSPANYDYTDVFLHHAQMYVFADYYGIEPLQILAVQKLHRALTSLNLVAKSHHEVTRLARYTFEHTVEEEGQDDRLRTLVCLYVACKVKELWEDLEFRNVTKMFPEFATGIITSMLDRLK